MFDIILSLLKVGGISRILNNKLPLSKYYFIYATVVILHPLILFVLEVAELRNTVQVYEEFLDQLVFFPIHFLTIFKTVLLCVNYKKVNRLMEDLLFERNFLSSIGDEFKKRIDDGIRKIGILSTIYSYTVLVMAVITTGSSLFKILGSSSDDFTTGEVKCRKMLILYSLIPFPTSTKWFCVVGYLYQLTAIIVYVIHILISDIFFVLLLTHLNIDARVLQQVFASVKKRALEKMSLPEDYSLLYDEMYPELEQTVNEEMKNATKSLQRLLRISSDVESLYQYISFVQVLFSLCNLMCCLFVTTTVEAFSPAFFVQVQVYFGLAFQLSFYCIFAHYTSIAFSGIPFAIYENSWFSAGKAFKKMMIINIMRMNQPVHFTAGKFVELTLPLLVRILRLSYSFYTVLRK